MSLNPKIGDWRGKRVWLVGASTGIGQATAQLLHSLGAQVVVSARSQDSLNALASQCTGIQTERLDVSDAQAVTSAAQHILGGGPLDLVMFCAGVYQPLRAPAMTSAVMAQHMLINYQGAVHVTHAIMPSMLAAKRGHLCYVSSVAGFRGLPNALAYGPTKAALINFAEVLYLDLRDQGVGVSVVNPGFVQTPLTANNQFHMPALIQPSQAAQEILAGWRKGQFEIHFPKRFTWWLKALRVLPYGLYFMLTRRFTGL